MSSASAWQVGCTCVHQRCVRLLELGAWSDCCFLAGARRERVPAHRLMLAMASPVFEAMLFGPLAECGECVELPDIEADTFRALLKYIYTDVVEITSCAAARALCYAAEKYMLPQLMSEAIEYLIRSLSSEDAALTYEFALLIEQNKLKEKCLEVIRTNTMDVLSHDSFGELHLETVVDIFSLEPLNITSELDLFEAAIDYVVAQSENVTEEEPSETDEAASNYIVNDEIDNNGAKNNDNADGEAGAEDAENNGTNSNGTDNNNCVNDNGAEGNNAATNGTLNGEAVSNNAVANNNDTSRLVAETHNDSESNGTIDEKMAKDCAKENESENIGDVGNISYIQAETNEVKNNSDGEKDRNTGLSIRNAIEKIRFLTLDHQEFANYDFSALLSQPEVCAIAMNLMSRSTFRQMPSGFSTSRTPRHKLTDMEEDSGRVATIRTTVMVMDLYSLTCHWSTQVIICDVPWQLKVYITTEAGNKFLSVFLHCDASSKVTTTWLYEVDMKCRLLSNRIDTEPFCVHGTSPQMFSNSSPSRGWPNFMKWVDLMDPERGYVKHNSITLEARVAVKMVESSNVEGPAPP